MRLRHAMFAGWITGLTLFGPDLALAGDATLQLRLNFSTASLFDRIGATAGKRRERDQEEDRQGPHPLILEMKLAKANRRL
jgi:hypothetical protein